MSSWIVLLANFYAISHFNFYLKKKSFLSFYIFECFSF
jgi:hypothetical protein